MKKFLAVLFLIVISQAKSQDADIGTEVLKFKTGISVIYGMNSHVSDFQALPGFVSNLKNSYTGSNTGSINFGLNFEYPLNPIFSLKLGAVYAQPNAEMLEEEFVAFAGGTNFPVYENFYLDATIAMMQLTPSIIYRPFEEGLQASVGFTYGLLLTKDFHQYEELRADAKEQGVAIINEDGEELPTFNDISAELPDAAAYMGVNLAVGYEYYLTKSISVVPEVGYQMQINNLLKDVDWKINSINAGITINYSFHTKEYSPEEIREMERRDSIRNAEVLLAEQRRLDSIAAEQRRQDSINTAKLAREKWIADSIADAVKENELSKHLPKSDADFIYILIHSDKNEDNAKNIKKYLINKGVKNVDIIQWQNPKDEEDLRFRVVISGFDTYTDAYNKKVEIDSVIKELMDKFNILEKPVIQSE